MKGIYGNEPERRSETLADLLGKFAFWMSPELISYAEREADLPFDEHFLKALIAPRTLYVSEAAGDLWANPVGSYETTLAAGEVYRFLNAGEHLYWSFRPGFHEHCPDDVALLVNVLRHERDGEELLPQFFRTPFVPPENAFDWRMPEN